MTMDLGRRFTGIGVSGMMAVVLAAGMTAPAAWAGSGRHGGGGGGSGSVSVTNPGSQVSSTTQSVTLQIRAGDTNGGALSYSATGLPAGLVMNATTGAITGSPSAASQSTTQVTVRDSVDGATASTTFEWTVNGAYDVSYPQCGVALPAPAGNSIVGVNDGILYSSNPCLGSEAGWGAGHGLQFYANTGDPGPAYSSHWPKAGQASPENCTTADQNSTACSYDYGYNAALDSFQRALGTSGVNPAGVAWWLDVETGNSWQSLESAYGQSAPFQLNDAAALHGEIAGLQSEGVARVGIYSTAYQWTQITGGTGSTFAGTPAWLAGYSSQATAHTACTSTSFTGGPVTFTQYTSGGVDADFPC